MADIRERLAHDEHEESLRTAIDGRLASLWTAIPGIITKVTLGAMTVEVQPAVKATQEAQDGTTKSVNLPILMDCPIIFPNGGNHVLTFPVAVGDEALVIIASRCIDGWWQQGGVQTAPMLRMHDLSDGFALVGPRSQARLVPNISTTAVELRAVDRSSYVSLNAATGAIVLKAPGGVTIDADATITGNLTVSGVSVTHGGKNIGKDHTHGGVTTGDGTTGVPT